MARGKVHFMKEDLLGSFAVFVCGHSRRPINDKRTQSHCGMPWADVQSYFVSKWNAIVHFAPQWLVNLALIHAMRWYILEGRPNRTGHDDLYSTTRSRLESNVSCIRLLGSRRRPKRQASSTSSVHLSRGIQRGRRKTKSKQSKYTTLLQQQQKHQTSATTDCGKLLPSSMDDIYRVAGCTEQDPTNSRATHKLLF